MGRVVAPVVAIVISTLCGIHAQAAPIVPGGVQFPAVAEPDPVGAALVITSGAIPFTAGTFAGTLTSSVFTNDASNPFGPNALTFTYQVTNGAGSAHDIERLAVSNYDGFLTDASFQSAAGVPPTMITRSSDGQVMGFNFIAPAIDGGQTSSLLVVQTNATSFQPTTASLINGTTATVASYAPLAVPEPAALSALAFGAAALRRRRR
jgi:hypothetical protein